MGGNKEFAVLVQTTEPSYFINFIVYIGAIVASSRPMASDSLAYPMMSGTVNGAARQGALETFSFAPP